MASYSVNERGVVRARELIQARQYVLRSEWKEVQPRAAEQNAFLKSHSWDEYASWHLGLTVGAARRDEGEVRVRLRRLSPRASDGINRLPLPCRGMAPQGDRAGGP